MLGNGKKPGDMKCDVSDVEYPDAGYAGQQPGKTTEYVSRQNKTVKKEAADIKAKNYKGRYE